MCVCVRARAKGIYGKLNLAEKYHVYFNENAVEKKRERNDVKIERNLTFYFVRLVGCCSISLSSSAYFCYVNDFKRSKLD